MGSVGTPAILGLPGKGRRFQQTHSDCIPRAPCPAWQLVTGWVCFPDVGSCSPVFPQEMKEEAVVSSRDITQVDLDVNRTFGSHTVLGLLRGSGEAAGPGG